MTTGDFVALLKLIDKIGFDQNAYEPSEDVLIAEIWARRQQMQLYNSLTKLFILFSFAKNIFCAQGGF